MKNYAYSPATGELIQASVIAEWMGSTTIAPPEFDPAVSSCFWREGEWVVISVDNTPTADDIAARRWQAETSGMNINGLVVDTDDRSKLLINGAALEATFDPAYTMQWKTSAGFVELTGAQVIGIARAVRAHVQTCFDREAELLAALEAGTLTDEMLGQGWP